MLPKRDYKKKILYHVPQIVNIKFSFKNISLSVNETAE